MSRGRLHRSVSAPCSEAGSSPITAVFGFVVLLAFLFGGVQLSLHLFASSAVSAAAFDAARSLAAEGSGSCLAARERALSVLGAYGQDVTVVCPDVAPDVAAVRITGPSPAPLLDGFFGLGFDLGGIEREAQVRVERFRPGAGP